MNQFLDPATMDFARVRDGRRSMPLYVDIDLSTARSIAGTGANAALVMNVAGNSFYSDQNALQGIATVHFQDTNLSTASAPITVNPGFIANVPYTQLLIENTAQPGYRLRIFYGVDIDFQPGTGGQVIVAGTVAVIDGGKSRTKSGVAFSGCVSLGPVAAQYPYVQLWNPVGSGKNLVVEQVNFQSAVAATNGVPFKFSNIQLATLASNPHSKMGGYADSTAQLRTENSPTVAVSTASLIVITPAMPSYRPFEPIVIPPGWGLNSLNAVLNSDIAVGFEFYEDPV